MTGRTRPSQKEIIQDKIAKIKETIKNTEEKLSALKLEKKNLENELKDIEATEIKVRKEAEMKKICALIEERDISFEEIKKLLTETEEKAKMK